MNKYSYVADRIKESVSIADAIAMYVPNPPPRHNRILCPIHGGSNYNMAFTDKVYYCFVCGSGGDVISFVQHIFDLNFAGAIEKINADFGLGIPIERRMTLREQREAELTHKRIVAERERVEAEREAESELYNALWDEWIRLDKNRTDYAPQSDCEEPNPLFVEALQKLDYQGYLITALL